MWHGQFPIFIFTQLKETTYTHIWLTKKSKKFKWTDEAEKAFNDIKKLLVNLPVLKAPTPDGLFRLESDTSQVQTAFYWFLPCLDLLPVALLFAYVFPGFLVPRCALLFGEYL